MYDASGSQYVVDSVDGLTDLGPTYQGYWSFEYTPYSASHDAGWQRIFVFTDQDTGAIVHVLLIYVAGSRPTSETLLSGSGLTVERVRTFLGDITGQNLLIDGLEFSDKDIEVAADLAVSRYNVTPPVGMTTTVDSFPEPGILLIGVAGYLLRSKSLRYMRNKATYQSTQIPVVELEDRFEQYAQMGEALIQDYTEMVRIYKVSKNMESWSGHLPSPMVGSLYRFRWTW